MPKPNVHLLYLILSMLPGWTAGQIQFPDSLPPPGSEPGSAYVELYLPQDAWHGFCLPVKSSVTYPFTVLQLDMKWYDEPLHQWVQVADPTGDSLLESPMMGYMVYSNSSQTGNSTLGIKGQLNTGTITIPVTTTWSPAGDDGWNLIGNPYPSAVSWDLVELNSVDPTLYIYSPTWKNYIFWNRNNQIHSSICRSILPAMQGFFVHCSLPSPGTGQVVMTNAARLHDPGQIYQDNPDYDRLLVVSAQAGGLRDESDIWLNDAGNSGYDPAEDALKRFGDPQAPQLFCILPGRIPAALDVAPWLGDSTRVILGFYSDTPGMDTLEFSNISSFPDSTGIWLLDQKLNSFQDLKEDPRYLFSYEPGEDTSRFEIVFHNPVSGLSGVPFRHMGIWSFEGRVYVDLRQADAPGGIRLPMDLIDLEGRYVYHAELLPGRLNTLSPGLPPGYYIVRVNLPDQMTVAKVVLN